MAKKTGSPSKSTAKKSNINIKPSKEGSFRAAVGVKEGQKVSTADENKILSAKEGAKVTLSTGKTIAATASMKKKANFAKNFSSKK